jgi:sulfate permease, SulP family
MQFGLGLVRAGFVVNFLSRAVISGFTSAAAIVIGVSQLRPLLGIDGGPGGSVFRQVGDVLLRFGEANPWTAAIGLGSVLVLAGTRRILPRFPAALVVVAVATALTALLRLDLQGVRIVGAVPDGLPAPALPPLEPGLAAALLMTALTISFVGFVESFAVARSFATREKYRIDADQELRALGLANVAAGLFSGYPVTGGLSRSAVNYQAGARTGLAGIITALIILVALYAFTSLFHFLPTAALAAVIVVAVANLIDLREALHLHRLKPVDGWTVAVTFMATLTIGIEQGILLGVAFSLLVFIWRSAYPHYARLGYLARERVFRNVNRFPEVRTFPGTLILRVDASLYFANMSFLEGVFREALLQGPALRHIVLDFSGVNDMDAVAVETLESLMDQMRVQGIDVHIACMKGPVRDITARAGWPHRFGERIAHFSVDRALEAAGIWSRVGESAPIEIERP